MIANLSIVIVGRNVARQLKQIYAAGNSLQVARDVVYVDSASEDESVSLASAFGWKVIRLSPEGILSPAAGRSVGTLQATGDSILFLDADMELLKPEELPDMVAWLREHPHVAGICGDMIDQYPDGRFRRRGRRHRAFEEVRFFGGMILLDKARLLSAGNWNPSVLANEEVELYARLKRDGATIVFHPALECLHHTHRRSLVAELRSVYIPLTERERLFYGGYGMAARAAWASGSLWQLIRLSPEPLTTLGGGLVALLSLAMNLPFVAMGILAVVSALILSRRSVLYIAACPGLALQMLVGLLRYRERTPVLCGARRSDSLRAVSP